LTQSQSTDHKGKAEKSGFKRAPISKIGASPPRRFAEIRRVANKGVQLTIAENRRYGISDTGLNKYPSCPSLVSITGQDKIGAGETVSIRFLIYFVIGSKSSNFMNLSWLFQP
jgi:hypothetical protein